MSLKVATILTICLSIFVVLSGCIECETNADCAEGASCIDGQCVGTSFRPIGVEMSFLAESPPNDIVATEPFDIYIELTNVGSYTIPIGELEVKLHGGLFDQSGESWINEEEVRGAEQYEEFGDIIFIDKFKGANYTGSKDPGSSYPFSIAAEAKYNYKTAARGSICVLGKNEEKTEAFCSETGNKLKSIDSAPVTISEIKEYLYPESIEVEIVIRNAGRGEVCKLGSECTDRDDKNYVKLDSFELDGVDFTDHCKQEVRLASTTNAAVIECTGINRTIGSTKEQTANIVIAYQYKDSLQKVIRAAAY